MNRFHFSCLLLSSNWIDACVVEIPLSKSSHESDKANGKPFGNLREFLVILLLLSIVVGGHGTPFKVNTPTHCRC